MQPSSRTVENLVWGFFFFPFLSVWSPCGKTTAQERSHIGNAKAFITATSCLRSERDVRTGCEEGSRGGGGWQQDTDEPCRRDGWEVGSRPLIMSGPRRPVCVPLTKIDNLVKISFISSLKLLQKELCYY